MFRRLAAAGREAVRTRQCPLTWHFSAASHAGARLLQVLYPDTVASLLSLVHQHLADARHARHGLQALGPLRALLQLLGPHMCEPATFRYAVHIALQAMDKP